jgi:Fe2+ or Zn2+ uptake regulation protein
LINRFEGEFTAFDLIEAMKAKRIKMSLSTAYNTLIYMEQEGLLNKKPTVYKKNLC